MEAANQKFEEITGRKSEPKILVFEFEDGERLVLFDPSTPTTRDALLKSFKVRIKIRVNQGLSIVGRLTLST